MTRQTDKLERQTLALFKLACRQNRLDVAEYFLQALETLERQPGVQEPTSCKCALRKAYGELSTDIDA